MFQEYKYIREYPAYISQEIEEEKPNEYQDYIKCLWCGSKIIGRHWCDSYCWDLWEMYNSR